MILYSTTTCQRCEVLKTKLKAKAVPFVEVTDEATITSKNIEFLPVLEVDGQLLDFKNANDFINSL